jgi:hypothetical protein
MIWVVLFCVEHRRRERERKNMLRRMTLDFMRQGPTRTIYFGDTASTMGSRYPSMSADAVAPRNETLNIRRVSDTGDDEDVEVVSFRAFGGGSFSLLAKQRSPLAMPSISQTPATPQEVIPSHFRKSLQPMEERAPSKQDVARVRALLGSWDAFTTSEEAMQKARRSVNLMTIRSSVRTDELDPLDPGPPASGAGSTSTEGHTFTLSEGSRRAMSLILRNAESSTDWRELINSLPPDFVEAHISDRGQRQLRVNRTISPTWSVTTASRTVTPPSTPDQAGHHFAPGHRARSKSEGLFAASKEEEPALRPRSSSLNSIVPGGRADDQPVHGVRCDDILHVDFPAACMYPSAHRSHDAVEQD